VRRRALLRTGLLALALGCSAQPVRVLERRAQKHPRPEAVALLASESPGFPLESARRGPTTLKLLSARLPAVMGRVNGREIPLLVDTGTTGLLLSGEAAVEAGAYLPPGETIEAISPGHVPLLRIGTVDAVELGAHRFGLGRVAIPVRTADYRRWSGLDRDVFGIVGCSVLSHFRVIFDFKRNELRLEPHGQPSRERSLLAPVRVNGQSLWLMVDTGARGVFLEPWAARKLGLVDAARAKELEHKADTPTYAPIEWTELDSLIVDSELFVKVSAGVVNTFDDTPTSDGLRPAGLLGIVTLGRHVWTIDFAERRLSVLRSRG